MEFLLELSVVARAWWGLWLMTLFVGIVVWAMWPSRKRREEMSEAALIPFREDDDPANIETR